jgi:hypothetical protein
MYFCKVRDYNSRSSITLTFVWEFIHESGGSLLIMHVWTLDFGMRTISPFLGLEEWYCPLASFDRRLFVAMYLFSCYRQHARQKGLQRNCSNYMYAGTVFCMAIKLLIFRH